MPYYIYISPGIRSLGTKEPGCTNGGSRAPGEPWIHLGLHPGLLGKELKLAYILEGLEMVLESVWVRSWALLGVQHHEHGPQHGLKRRQFRTPKQPNINMFTIGIETKKYYNSPDIWLYLIFEKAYNRCFCV